MLRRKKIEQKIRDWLIRNPECLHHIAEMGGVFESTYIRGGQDAERESSFRAGRQEMAHDIIRLAHLSKNELMDLHAEEFQAYAEEAEEPSDD